MKKLSLFLALSIFLIFGTALNGSASEILEVTQQDYVSVEVSNEIEFTRYLADYSMDVSVTEHDLEDLALLCIVNVEFLCGDNIIDIEAEGDNCDEAANLIEGILMPLSDLCNN